MCDKQMKSKYSICRGCLSSDRKLSTLKNHDVYWYLLKKDQKRQALSAQYIAMCWECTATLRRMHAFQAQVQRAHDILLDSTCSPSEHILSSLTVHLKREYDAIFQEQNEMFQTKIPVNTNLFETSTTDEKKDIKNNVNVTIQFKEEKYSVENSFTSDYNGRSNLKFENDSDTRTSIDDCIHITISDNSDVDNEADYMIDTPDDQADDNMIVPPTETTTRRSVRQAVKSVINKDVCVNIPSDSDAETAEADDIIVTGTETSIRRRVRKAAKKCSQLIVKTKEKKGKAKLVKKVNTQFVCVPIKPLSNITIVKTSGSPINIEKNQETKQVFRSETKQVPLVKTPVLLKLEEELKQIMCSKNAAQKGIKNKMQKCNDTNKVSETIDDIESSDYELSDIEFSDIEGDRNKKNVLDNKIKSMMNEHSDMYGKDRYDCNKYTNENQNSQPSSEDNESNDSNDKPSKKRKRSKRVVDPEFIPVDAEDDETRTDRKEIVESTKQSKYKKKYNKTIVQYDRFADVTEYFTEMEMSEQEMRITLEREDEIVLEKKPFKCDMCGQCFKHKRTLDYHLKWGHGKKHLSKFQELTSELQRCLWRCNICHRMLRRAHLVSHVNEHHRHRYQCAGQGCEWSPRVFMSRSVFEQHWHDIHRRGECGHCGRQMWPKTTLLRHIQAKHVPSSPVLCSVCGCSFPTRGAYRTHAHTHAPAEARYCVECDVTYNSVQQYRKHVSDKHRPRARVEGFTCHLCGRVLRREHNLKNHLAVMHGGTTKYQCRVCEKYFTKRQALRHHVARHGPTPIEPPKTKRCFVCERMFTTNRQLRFHMYTHTGERPYKCSHCDAAFTQPYCLSVHLAKTHGDTHTKVHMKDTHTEVNAIDTYIKVNTIAGNDAVPGSEP